jgi:hypothetical protein
MVYNYKLENILINRLILLKLGKNVMKGKILIGSIIALVIAFSGVLGINQFSGTKAVLAYDIPLCDTVTYGPWSNCVNGLQTRDVIGMTPFYCTMTANEQAGRSQICGQVLGVKLFAVGTLLRNEEGKIYVVTSDNGIKLIPDQQALQAYRGRDIYGVSNALINQYRQVYGEVLGAKVYANGTLLRSPDNRVYIVTNGQLQYVNGLEQLKQYAGRNIYNISWKTLADYQQISSSGQVLGVKTYANGTLLRSPEMKVYVVTDGKLKYVNTLSELKSYAGQTIYNVSYNTLAQYPLISGQVLGVKIYADGTLLRTPDMKIYVITNGQKHYIRTLGELYQYRNTRIIDVSYSVLANF